VITTYGGQIFSGAVTVPGTQGVCGVYFVQAFNGDAGDVLTGSVTASSAVDVYVMPSAALTAWGQQILSGGNCIPSNLVSSQIGTTSYDLKLALPSSGTYEFVVNNLSSSSVTVQISMDLNPPSTPPQLVTTVVLSTMTIEQVVQTLTPASTFATQTPAEASFPGDYFVRNAFLMIFAVAVLISMYGLAIGLYVLSGLHRDRNRGLYD